MKKKDLIVLSAISLLAGCDFGLSTSIEKGEDQYDEIHDCNSLAETVVTDAVNLACQYFSQSDCLSIQTKCGTHRRELFSGVDLKNTSGKANPVWNGQGGRGQLMANAAVCLMSDLAQGEKINKHALETPAGEISLNQSLGLLQFNPEKKEVKAYQSLNICMPVLGCLDAATQTVSLVERQNSYLQMLSWKAGDYTISNSYALELNVDEFHKKLELSTPPIPVDTPAGPISVQPAMTYQSNTSVIFSPYTGNSSKASVPFFGNLAILLTDLYGRTPGTSFESNLGGFIPRPGSTVGWNSQVGLGQRDANPHSVIWAPSGTDPSRPDLDLSVARVQQEKDPSIGVSVRAKVAYSPKNLLPLDLNEDGVDLNFNVFVEPKLDAAFSGQFHLFLGEGQSIPFSEANLMNHFQTGEKLILSSGISSHHSFVLSVGMDLKAVYLPPVGPGIPIIDVHPRFEVPITESTVFTPGASAYATSWSDVKESPTFAEFKTFHSDQSDLDGQEFIHSCLSQKAQDKPKPQPRFKAGNGADLFAKMLYPCNVCVGSKAVQVHTGGVDINKPGSLSLITQSVESADWKCNQEKKVGCMDLCTYDPGTKTLSIAKRASQLTDLEQDRGCYLD
jgi:hypothetical protein